MKSLFISLFLLFIVPTGLVAEEIDVSKGMVVALSSGKIALPPLNTKMTDANLGIAGQATLVAMDELGNDLIMYENERRQLLRDINFYKDRTLEDRNALDKIIADHQADEAEIAQMKKEFDISSARQLSVLESKISRWLNGNFVKFEFAKRQAVWVLEYSDRLKEIQSARLRVRPKVDKSARLVHS